MKKKETKYYAVANGREKGVFDSWEDCEDQTAYFKGAKFKKVKSLKEAEMFIIDESDGEPPFVICIRGKRRAFDSYGDFLEQLEKINKTRTKGVQVV